MESDDRISPIREAIDRLDVAHARTLLKEALKAPTAEIYYLASMVALNERQKRDYLNKAIVDDPFHEAAHHELALLDGKSMPPTKQPIPPPVSVNPVVHQRYTPPVPPPPIAVEPTYVLGTVFVETPLYALPHEDSAHVATIPSTTNVIVISRTEKTDWFYCVYLNTLGSTTNGWIPASALRKIAVQSKHVNSVDIPLTQYEGHSRHDIEKLANLKMQVFKKVQGKILAIVLIPFFIIIWFGFSQIERSVKHEPFPVVPAIMLGILFVASLVWAIKLRVASNVDAMLAEVKELRRLVKTEAELLQDRQFQQDLLKVAASVGGTMLTRYVPNRQEITHKHR